MSKLVAENDIKDETWLQLPDDRGDKLVKESPDAHWASSSTFTLYKADHTIANLLRMKLHTNNACRFAGYKIPHPTVANVELVVQVPGGEPCLAVLQAIDEIITDIDQFSAAWERDVAPKAAALDTKKSGDNVKDDDE